jgi:hypothetical protein
MAPSEGAHGDEAVIILRTLWRAVGLIVALPAAIVLGALLGFVIWCVVLTGHWQVWDDEP